MIATNSALLLRACREQPDEDTPRLILADSLEEDGNQQAAAYLRESVVRDRKGEPKPRRRAEAARGYMRWLESLFSIPPTDQTYATSGICGGEGWDRFYWTAGEGRRCRLDVNRGLPYRVSLTCPMLLEQAAKLFLFPLTHVIVSDRKAELVPAIHYGEYQMERHYLWVEASYPQKFSTWEDDAHHIPAPLYRYLDAKPVSAHYDTHSEAMQDLHRAALAFGRAAVAEAER